MTQRLYAEPLACFHRVFTSCDLGVPLTRILFFDDTSANVEGARAIGMPAVHVRRLDDIVAAVDWIR